MQITASAARGKPNLRVRKLVEVRSEEEILATLDVSGELDSLPFMPETLQHCGKRLTVHKVAHKLCDTMTRTGMRQMRDAVHLAGVRYDRQAHGGCQTGCLIYWTEVWLSGRTGLPERKRRRRAPTARARSSPSGGRSSSKGSRSLEEPRDCRGRASRVNRAAGAERRTLPGRSGAIGAGPDHGRLELVISDTRSDLWRV